ncbi:isoaspartyl peptidase/L-asparaginase [SAR86 cluster bacterium]|jgi:beta-aspartyl-peptidase (threonine type)|nr:isoaspartyl peptidase/L-asparaginase [SAR86 cluster bacterium]|tara:strand:+ start:971 stop:1906 length:936 start_codon:yes stop_codon:yes gene_type:complete
MKKLIEVFLPLIISLSLFAESPAIVIHGGAGWFSNMSPDEIKDLKKGLKMAADKGFDILENGGSSVDAVEAAIIILEDNPLFNAGRGSVYTSEERQEMDASIMTGKDNEAGAVSSVTNVKNPISLARHVMEETPHVMFTSSGAEKLARDNNIEQVEQSYFANPDRLKSLKKAQENKKGTVGVVAIDKNRVITAGTSTGGMTNKAPGRVGDSPIIGAGTWVENNSCGVSATGHGEYFIRFSVAKEICVKARYQNKSIQQASTEVMNQLKEIGADGGVIVMDNKGNYAFAFNTPAMARAYKDASSEVIKIYKN